jgi:hypothetical protein
MSFFCGVLLLMTLKIPYSLNKPKMEAEAEKFGSDAEHSKKGTSAVMVEVQ